MLGDGLGCNRVPTLIINFDAPVKLTEEVVSVFVELVQLLIVRLAFLVHKIISLGSLVSVIIIRMVNKLLQRTFKDHHVFLLGCLVSLYKNFYFI